MKSFRILSLAIAAAACGQGHAAAIDSARADSTARAEQDSINRAQPGYIVDSILPVDEQIRRFRATILAAPTQLDGGATSIESLASAFVKSLEARDTAALVRLTISRAEFAYLVYPESPFAVEPLQQSPDLVWLRHSAANATGLARLLERLAGQSLGYQSLNCDRTPGVEGKNRIWKNCVVRYGPANGQEESRKLFGGIIEREGRFKILSYASAF